MKQIDVYRWWLPPPAYKPRGKPYLSTWRMSVEEAAARHPGAKPEPSTREVLEVPETPEEEAALRRRIDTSRVGRDPG